MDRRADGHVITKISQMGLFARGWSSAMRCPLNTGCKVQQRNTIYNYLLGSGHIFGSWRTTPNGRRMGVCNINFFSVHYCFLMLIDLLYTKLHMAQPVPGSQTLGKTRKKKVREKLVGREKGRSFLPFYFRVCSFAIQLTRLSRSLGQATYGQILSVVKSGRY